jgi:hypothetical protein
MTMMFLKAAKIEMLSFILSQLKNWRISIKELISNKKNIILYKLINKK